MIRTAEQNGKTYVSVTSAMKGVKSFLGWPEDYYGPLGRLHAMEGEGAHRVCLDWMASPKEPAKIPLRPKDYPSEQRWYSVMERCIKAFQEFVAQYKVNPIGIEQEDWSLAYGLVGHIDLPAYFTVPRPNGRCLDVRGPIDLKFTSAILESHRLQVRCYGRLDGMTGSNLGGIFHCDRHTGKWKFEEVSLTKNLEDFQAVYCAAYLYRWGERKRILLANRGMLQMGE